MAKSKSVENNEGSVGVTMEQAVKEGLKADDQIVAMTTKVENTPKNMVVKVLKGLIDNNDTNNFKIGGYLARVRENKWIEPYDTFAEFCLEELGFKERKALYLIKIYETLNHHQIEWGVVSKLGWTKIKELLDVITAENVNEWVEKAEPLTVSELQALLAGGEGGEGKTKTKSDGHKISFSLHPDQVDAVESALNKAKAEVDTEFDNVALETICSEYLTPHERQSAVVTPDTAVKYLQTLSVEEAVALLQKAHPSLEVNE